jgi:hypothetical protein
MKIGTERWHERNEQNETLEVRTQRTSTLLVACLITVPLVIASSRTCVSLSTIVVYEIHGKSLQSLVIIAIVIQ